MEGRNMVSNIDLALFTLSNYAYGVDTIGRRADWDSEGKAFLRLDFWYE